MAVTLDAFSSAARGSNTPATTTLTHALGASANYLAVSIASIGTHTFTVTAGGVNMLAGPAVGPVSGTTGFTRWYYLLDASLPAPGSISIVVTPSQSSARCGVGAWSLIGAVQTALGSLRSNSADVDLGPSSSVSLTGVPAGAAVLTGMCNNTSPSATTSSGMVEDANFDGLGGTANQVFGHSLPVSTSTVTHSFTSPSGTGSYISALMVEILPLGASTVAADLNLDWHVESEEPPTGMVVGAYYPEYAADTVPHAAVPWALLDEIEYFGVTWRIDHSSSLNVTTNVFACAGHPFVDGQAVQLRAAGGDVTSPVYPSHAGGNLAPDTNYFARDVVSGVSFKLALTAGGAALDFTSTTASNSNGRRWKAPAAFLNRYEFGSEVAVDNAAVASLIAARDAANPACRIYLVLGRDHSVTPLKESMDYNSATKTVDVGSRAGLPDIIAAARALFDLGFDGISTDIESMNVTGTAVPFGGDGAYVYDLHEALRDEFPAVSINCFFTRSGPANTMEVLANELIDVGFIDAISVNGYALAFPGSAGSRVWHHGALNGASDFGTPTGNTAVYQIETIAQYTGAGVPIDKIRVGLQAGGVPWLGGQMNSPAGSVGHGARFPLDGWAGGGTSPTTPPEVTYRKFLAGELAWVGATASSGSPIAITGSAIDEAADAFFAWRTHANAGNELFWSSENPATAAVKRAYWQDQGIGGLFLWQLVGDDASWSIITAMQPEGATPVGASLSLLWNSIGRVASDLTAVWVVSDLSPPILSSPGATYGAQTYGSATYAGSVQEDEIATVSADLNLRWSNLEVVATDATIRWRILMAVGQDSTLRWLLGQNVIADGTLQWTVLGAVTADLAARWLVSSNVAADATLLWHTSGIVASDATLRWMVNEEVGQNADLRWMLRQNATADATLLWLLAANVEADSTIRWLLTTDVAASSDLRWLVFNSATADVDLRWSMTGRIEASADLRWAIEQQGIVTNEVALRWLVGQQVASDATLRWLLRANATADSDLRWLLGGLVTADADLRWTLGDKVASDLIVRWLVRQTVTADVSLPWTVVASVGADLTARWQVLQTATANSDLRWLIRTLVPPSDISLRWGVSSLATNTVTARWLVYETAQTGLEPEWHVLGSVIANKTLRWDVGAGGIGNTMSLRWTLNARVSADLGLRWDIGALRPDAELVTIPVSRIRVVA